MKFTARSIAATSAVWALAACSGGHIQPVTGLPAAESRNSSTALLYIAADSYVNVYNQAGKDQKPIDMLTGFGTVGGVHVAPNGDVSISDINADTISFYHQGQHTAFLQLTDAHNPGRIAVDSNGTVYVNNTVSNYVSVYANGSTTPTAYLQDSFGCYSTSVATDASDDLFVSSGCGVIDEFLAGQATPTVLGNGFGYAEDIAIDSNQNLVVDDQTANDHEIAIYAPPYAHRQKELNDGTDYINAIALGGGGTALWFTDMTKHYGSQRTYPGLKRSRDHTSTQGLGSSGLYGIAVYPPETN